MKVGAFIAAFFALPCVSAAADAAANSSTLKREEGRLFAAFFYHLLSAQRLTRAVFLFR